ncbi:chromate transporter [Muribaculum intestinale]|uniref:chromate transporter n=1 Tax=Muribaculum intestinale TaxID=1796646 RepID=UPI003C6D4A13
MSIQDNKPDMEENSTAGRRIYRPLFWTFLKIGAFTFGGGWAMISIIEREIVDKHHWIRREEFLDLLAVSQSLPGILAVNISVSIGDSLRGLKGSVVAALGTILPSFLIILAIAIFLTPDIIKDNAVVSAIFKGIRPCVVALIIAPVLTSARSAKIGWRTVWIPVAVALMIYFGANPIWFILLGGVGGWLWLRRVNRRIREASENNEEKGGER